MKKLIALSRTLFLLAIVSPSKSFAADSFTVTNVSYNSNNQQLTFTATNQYDNGANWDAKQDITGYNGDNVGIIDTNNNNYGQSFFQYPTQNCSFINGTMTCTVTLNDNNELTASSPASDTQLQIVLWDQNNNSYSQTFTYGSVLTTTAPNSNPNAAIESNIHCQ